MRKSYFIFSILSLILPLKIQGSSSSTIIKENFPLTIKNPAISHQQRLKLKLPNGLEVLLISDYKTKISGAALVVHSGSWNNPKDHPGLAHLTEHCVFLGSKEYPGISDFSNHLTKYNGSYNAFTSDKATTYLFTVNNEGFFEALNQMSSFLKNPLFRESDINKEKTAVNEEFSRNKFNDQWRLFRLEQLISNPNHPIHLFSTGNLESLKNTSSKDLQAWFKQHYFAKNMKLIIFSSLPINILVEKVEECFSKIPENPPASSIPYSSTSESFFDDTSKNKIFITKPLLDRSIINLIWILPQEYFKDLSSIKQISFLLQHGNKDGLLDNLKKELLISQLKTDIYSHERNIEFNLEIELTEKGTKEYQNVLEQCFSYLNYLQDKNIPDYIFEEINITNALEYEFQDHQDLFSYLNLLSDQLSEENLSDYPSRQFLLKNNNSEINKSLLSYLANPENCRILFMTNSFPDNLESDTYYDPVYDLSYKVFPFYINNKSNSSTIKLPKKNFFLTNLNASSISKSLENEKVIFPFHPKEISKTKLSSIYYTLNDYIPSPKTSYELLISFPQNFSLDKHFVLIDLFVSLMNDALKDISSYANAASLTNSLSPSINGIKIVTSGFANNMEELLKSILNVLSAHQISQEKFADASHNLLLKYKTEKYKNPLYQGLDLLYNHILNNYVSLDQKISAISKISWKDFQLFTSEIFKKIFIEAMILGNVEKSLLYSFIKTIDNFSSDKQKYNVQNNKYPDIKKHLSQEIITENCPFDSNALVFSISKNNASAAEIALSSLLFKLLDTTFFEELRTKQQVGYAVGAKLKLISLQSLCGIFYIQSKQYSPKELLERTTVFLEEFQNNPLNYGISKESFIALRDSFVNELTHPDKSLEEICNYLFDLTFNPHNSQSNNSINKIIETTKTLCYEEFLEFIKTFLNLQKSTTSRIFINATH